MLFHVYVEDRPEGFYSTEPFGLYRTLLDADWFLWVLAILLPVIVVGLLMLAWRLHEIPTHKAHGKKMRQAELVTALTLLGLFEHWVWAVALFVAYTDWDAVEDFIVRILRRSRVEPPNGNAPPLSGKQAASEPALQANGSAAEAAGAEVSKT